MTIYLATTYVTTHPLQYHIGAYLTRDNARDACEVYAGDPCLRWQDPPGGVSIAVVGKRIYKIENIELEGLDP